MGFLYTCDLFKSPIFLPFNGKEQLSTKFGFILSLSLFLVLMNSCLNSDFFLHKKPAISLQTDSHESFGRMVFTRSNLTLITKIADFKGVSSIDLSYFYFNMSFTYMNAKTETIKMNKKFMKLCEPSDFTERDLYLNISYKSFCVSQKEPMILEGSISSGGAQYGVLLLSRCDQYSSNYYNITCKSKQETDVFFKDKFLYLYYADNKFDLTDLQNPVNPFLNMHLTYIYSQIKKTTFISFQKTMITTEINSNVINHDEFQQESFSVVRIDSDFTYDEKMVHEFFFLSDRSTQRMSRRYQNLQDLLAILGGITSTYFIIANFFLSNYKKFLIIMTVLNNLFTFEKTMKRETKSPKSNTQVLKSKFEVKKEENEICQEKTNVLSLKSKGKFQKTKKKSFEEESNRNMFPLSSVRLPEKQKSAMLSKMNSLEVIDHNKIFLKFETKEIINRKTAKKLRSISNEKNLELSEKFRKTLNSSKKKSTLFRLEKTKPSMKFGYFTFLRYQFKKKIGISLNKDERLLEMGVRTYLWEMDILNILKKVKEISKLKSIIFDPSQKILFDSIPKPFIQHNFEDFSREITMKESEIIESLRKNQDSKGSDIQGRLFDSIQCI